MFRIALKYGLLIVFLMFLWGVLEYITGVYTTFAEYRPVLALLSLTIPFIFLYMGIREAQKEYTGYFTYGQAFKTGLFITLVITLLYPLGQWLFFSFVSPAPYEYALLQNEAPLLAEGGEIPTGDEVAESYSLGEYLLDQALGALVGGVVISAILAIFVRDKTLPKGG